MKITKDLIVNEVKRITEEKDTNNKTSKIGQILLASAFKGANEKEIAELLEMKLSYVNRIGKSLRKNGIWMKDNKVSEENWLDKKSGGIAFVCDILVARGLLKRV
jgi:DNA-binding MarR family transcriptional regulator